MSQPDVGVRVPGILMTSHKSHSVPPKQMGAFLHGLPYALPTARSRARLRPGGTACWVCLKRRCRRLGAHF